MKIFAKKLLYILEKKLKIVYIVTRKNNRKKRKGMLDYEQRNG